MAAAEGAASEEIAARLGVSVDMVSTWRGRFAREGLKGLSDRPRRGRPSRLTPVQRAQIVSVACEPPPQDHGLAGWTLDRLHEEIERRAVAKIGRSWLQVQLARADLRPHKRKMWLHSPDPAFRQKVTAVVETYVDPPKGVKVLCIDEKTGMQAVERKHPDRPGAPGRVLRREYEYVRHGTQSLLAAFDPHDGEVLARCGATRTAADLEAFMDEVAEKTPGQVVVIWDNLNIHHGERWERFNERHVGEPGRTVVWRPAAALSFARELRERRGASSRRPRLRRVLERVGRSSLPLVLHRIPCRGGGGRVSEVVVARGPRQRASLDADAERLESLVRARGAYAHVGVRAARGHLLVENRSVPADPEVVARATPVGAGDYGLSFRTNAGRWEPMPVAGTLADVAAATVELLGPYLDPYGPA